MLGFAAVDPKEIAKRSERISPDFAFIAGFGCPTSPGFRDVGLFLDP
jgi:hypothetical protein